MLPKQDDGTCTEQTSLSKREIRRKKGMMDV
jgi:hypothetical protein